METTTDEPDTNSDDAVDGIDATIDEYTQVVKANKLNTTLNILDALVEETRLHFNDDGLVSRAVDPANVAMVDLQLASDSFAVYNPLDQVLGVSIERLTEIVNMADSDELVVLRLDPETLKLNISFDGLSFTIGLLDPDSIRDEPDIPDVDLPGRVLLEAQELSRGFTAADMVSDHISLGLTEDDTCTITATGDTDDVNVELDNDNYVEIDAVDVNSLFSLEYLKSMQGAMSSDTLVEIKLGDEFPVTMKFNYGDGDGSASYTLAPRLQD